MARARSPERDRAKELWLANKQRPLKDIAQELGITESRIRKWKCEDKWEQNAKGTFPLPQKERSFSKKLDKKLVQAVEQNEELTEKEKAFCIHFVKSFNAASACRAAGYGTAYPAQVGWEILQKPHIQSEVKRLKEIRNLSMMAGINDFVELHMRIAFANMNDFAYFGNGVVGLNHSDDVDGQLISEVKSGNFGPSIKLVDRHKSLAFLERWFEANPMDKHKKAFDEAKLRLEERALAAKEREQGLGDDEDAKTGVVALPNIMQEALQNEDEA